MRTAPTNPSRDAILGGTLLIVIGAVLLFAQLASVGGEAVPLAIGVAFLAAYAVRRQYGFLVPGGILTGVGAGALWQAIQLDDSGAEPILGLAAGFLLIYLVDWLFGGPAAARRWWPLIPGGILAVVGLSVLDRTPFAQWWPLVLVVLGLFLILRTAMESRAPTR